MCELAFGVKRESGRYGGTRGGSDGVVDCTVDGGGSVRPTPYFKIDSRVAIDGGVCYFRAEI